MTDETKMPHPELGSWPEGTNRTNVNEGPSQNPGTAKQFLNKPKLDQQQMTDRLWLPHGKRIASIDNLPTAGAEEYIEYVERRESAHDRAAWEESQLDGTVTTAPREESTSEPLPIVEQFQHKAESILDNLENPALDEAARGALQLALLDQAFQILTSQGAHGAIAGALDRADIARERLVQLVCSTMEKYRGDRVMERRAQEALMERRQLLAGQQFKTHSDRERAARLLDDFQLVTLVRALGNFENAAQIEHLMAIRDRFVGDVTGFGQQLLERQYDPIDVARILRIITAHPQYRLIDDNVAH